MRIHPQASDYANRNLVVDFLADILANKPTDILTEILAKILAYFLADGLMGRLANRFMINVQIPTNCANKCNVYKTYINSQVWPPSFNRPA